MSKTPPVEQPASAEDSERENIAAELAEPSPAQLVAKFLREDVGDRAQVAELGSSSVGINLYLTDDERDALLDELDPALESLGFR